MWQLSGLRFRNPHGVLHGNTRLHYGCLISVRRILHRDLRMHPYKIAIAQKLKGSDFENRTKLCRDLLNVRVTDVVFFLIRHISTSLAQ